MRYCTSLVKNYVVTVRFVLCAAIGNGGKTEKYEWTQTLQELSVVVPVPEGLKSRDIVCDITKSRLRVGVRGQPLLVDVSWRDHPWLLRLCLRHVRPFRFGVLGRRCVF